MSISSRSISACCEDEPGEGSRHVSHEDSFNIGIGFALQDQPWLVSIGPLCVACLMVWVTYYELTRPHAEAGGLFHGHFSIVLQASVGAQSFEEDVRC